MEEEDKGRGLEGVLGEGRETKRRGRKGSSGVRSRQEIGEVLASWAQYLLPGSGSVAAVLLSSVILGSRSEHRRKQGQGEREGIE